jgi:hypothetical protein
MEDTKAPRTMTLATTAVGRRARTPALNAAKHGLTAKKLLPEILGSEMVEDTRRRFYAEFQPATATEQHLVDELARHAAALARAEQIEDGLLRTSARGLCLAACVADDSDVQDKILAACVGADALDRLTRHRRSHERAFLATLERVHLMRGNRPPANVAVAPAPRLALLVEEETCRGYLRRRWEQGTSTCTSCAGKAGAWLGGRDLWQCRTCQHQDGLRGGTVMARSSLPLSVWFAAIYAVLREPRLSIATLCEVAGIPRRKTVVALHQRIRRALDSADSERLLAGLTGDRLEQLARCGR